MKLKANLHFHSGEDPQDSIPYLLPEGIDEASRLHFDVLAITLHNAFGYSDEMAAYAAQKNILLIPGIEKTIEGRHVLILNCEKSAEGITSFSALAAYRQLHTECFIVAPHPYYWIFSLWKKLEQHEDCFDAIEWSWYYSRHFHGANDRALTHAQKMNKPFIATSDTHRLRYLNRSFAIIESETKDAKSIINALRKGAFENVSYPSALFREILMDQIGISLRDEGMRMLAKCSRI